MMSARLAQSGELAQVEIELIGSVDEPGVSIAVVISMLPPSSRSIVFDLVMPNFFNASSNVSRQFRGVSYRLARDSSQSRSTRRSCQAIFLWRAASPIALSKQTDQFAANRLS